MTQALAVPESSVRLMAGDCRDSLFDLLMEGVMVDSVVCDPPYHLESIVKRFGKPGSKAAKGGANGRFSGLSAGFMGQTWDGADPEGNRIAQDVEFWKLVYAVMKPGAYVAAFSSPRTGHRQAVAMEMAGFIMHPFIGWAYGCLTEDAEILTRGGWKKGVDVSIGEEVAAWNPDDGSIGLSRVEAKTVAPWSGPMVRFRNHDTDQLLTPNHRVYHRPRVRTQIEGNRVASFDDKWSCSEAAEINRWNHIRLPLAGIQEGEGIGGVDYASLLGWIWAEGSFDKSPNGCAVRIYQSATANPQYVDELDALLGSFEASHSRYDRERDYLSRKVGETCWYFAGALAQRVRADLVDKRPTWDLMWRMTLAEKTAFWNAAMKGDGSLTSGQFYQKDKADLEWAQTLLHMMGQRGRLTMRASRDGGSITVTPRSTTELQGRHLKDASEDYVGQVWCVKVSTGAFVARRNGQIFITGNSGFPKAHSVSKAIDNAAGAERKVVELVKRRDIRNGQGEDRGANLVSAAQREDGPKYVEHAITAPATAAAEWDGWFYSTQTLKPAIEPIYIAQKPFSEKNGFLNVLKHGTGAMNIDGCRVEADGRPLLIGDYKETDNSTYAGRMDGSLAGGSKAAGTTDQGRWPANLIHDGSAEVVALFPDSKGQLATESSSSSSRNDQNVYGAMARGSAGRDPRGDDGSAARFFNSFPPDVPPVLYYPKATKADRQGSKHPTVKPVALMAHLCRLLTPPGGLVLDPFAGSGTTGAAALREGMRPILMERHQQYLLDIRLRFGLPLSDDPFVLDLIG